MAALESPEFLSWHSANREAFRDAFVAHFLRGASALKARLAPDGEMELYRVMGLDYDLLPALRDGKRDLGIYWAKSMNFSNGTGQFEHDGTYVDTGGPDCEHHYFWMRIKAGADSRLHADDAPQYSKSGQHRPV